MDDENTLVGTDAAAQILGVARSTVTRWAQSGRLDPVVKTTGIRGTYIFRREDVEAMTERKAS
ncbi:MAG: helix-turn-helix domain-containing protein [Leifsonia sp.]